MAETFDVVVIGTGSAASTAAGECRKAGWRVAVIDSRPFGGTCALRGCDPKKVLVGAAEARERLEDMKGRGLHAGGARIDWPELMRFKRTFTLPVPKAREDEFVKAGIAAYHGRARFKSRTTVGVGEVVLEGRYIVIASGARPADLHIPGAEHVLTSEQFLELDDLPPTVAFLGGGYISFEFAHVVARAGAKATILHRGARPLGRFDPDLVELLLERTREAGITVHLRTEAKSIHEDGRRLVVRAAGEASAIQADLVVHGAGRVPEIDDLDLAVAGVESGPRGVKVNEFLQSVSNPNVYAAGDAADSGPPLTPVAGMEGEIVARNLLGGNRHRPDYSGVASVVFSVPPLAAVGLGEEEARAAGLSIRVVHQDTSRWYSSRRIGETCSGFKTIVEEPSGVLLGAHVLGHHAEELVNLFALAIRKRLTAADLKAVPYAYPTVGSNVRYMV